MPRRPKCRRVGFMPNHRCFSPMDGSTTVELEKTMLTLDELEALRLSDYLLLDQQKAAEQMEVSRGTYQRILNSARYKTAEALLTGKTLQIGGGHYALAEDIACCKDAKKICQSSQCCCCDNCPRQNKACSKEKASCDLKK